MLYSQYFKQVQKQMKSIRPEEREVVHFPYFKRTIVTKKIQGSTGCMLMNQYCLNSIARNNVASTDIYLHYFHDVFTKLFHASRSTQFLVLKSSHISRFYLLFIQIVCLRRMAGQYFSLDALIKSTTEDLIDRESINEYQILRTFLQEEVKRIYSKYLNLRRLTNLQYLKSAFYVEENIKLLKEAMFSKLEIPKQLQLFKKQEHLPISFGDKQLVLYIKKNYECILNIQVLCRGSKKKVWEQFYAVYSNHMPIKIPFIETQSPENTIYLKCYSQEKNHFLSHILLSLSQTKFIFL